MGNGINLHLTKSIADLDKLLDEAIETASSKKLSVAHELHDHEVWRFQIGKHVQVIDDDVEDDSPIFWGDYGWEEDVKGKSCLWLEFSAEMCPEKYWDKLYKLVGSSGEYHSEVTFDFIHPNSGIVHFILKEEYLKQFFGENTDRNAQKKILTGLINGGNGNTVRQNGSVGFLVSQAASSRESHILCNVKNRGSKLW